MIKIQTITAITFITLATACNNPEKDPTFSGGTNTQTHNKQNKGSQNAAVFIVDGNKISPAIADNKSELKFYTKETILNVDAACEIASDDGNQHINIVIEGLGKGQDELKGNVDVAQTHSLVEIKDHNTQYNFTEGTLEVIEFSKKTGKVNVKITGKCAIKTGKSYTDMKIDIPAELNVAATFSNIRTFNYTTPRN